MQLKYRQTPPPLHVVVNTDSKIYIDRASQTFCHHDESGEEYVEIVYEMVLDYVIDVDLGRVILDLAIYSPTRDSLLYIKEGSIVEIVEVSGKKIYPLISEGSRVEFGDKLFYVLTNKNEVRVARSSVRGIVVFIGETFSEGTHREVAAIASAGDVREFSRCSY